METLGVENLRTYLFTRRGVGRAVDGVSFSIRPGETFGLVGESGSGKSLTCLSIIRLVPTPAARIVGGTIRFGRTDLLSLSEKQMRREVRGKQIAMVLQDPLSSLDPVFTIGDQVVEALRDVKQQGGRSPMDRAIELLRDVRVPSPEVRVHEYPHQMSGGMRQRVVIAMANACEPQLLIADEPTTALDVTTQAEVLKLLRDIQQRTGLSILMVTHDLSVVARTCHQVGVMYAGRIVENAPVRELFARPLHPYTAALVESIPRLHRPVTRLRPIDGQPPDIWNMEEGCRFAPRCPQVMDICRKEYPPEVMVESNRRVSCWSMK